MMDDMPLKWVEGTKQPISPRVDLDAVPASVRDQTKRMLRALGADAPWVEGPLAYTLLQGCGFGPASPGIAKLLNMSATDSSFRRDGWCSGLSELAVLHPEVPRVLWDTLAVMGLRPSPHEEEAIPNLGPLLPHPWSIADAALHAANKCTAFWADICNKLEKYSGRYPEHGCGCSHILRALPTGHSFPPMPRDRLSQTTREWWEHFLSEVALIHILGFPFSLHDRLNTYRGTLIAA